MPYTISRNASGEYCVYKRNTDGQPTGESLGCHKTRNEAANQIGAIERSEGMKMSEQTEKRLAKLNQADVNYTAVSTHSGEACAGCRWYVGNYCHLVENEPLSIEPTGYCDRYEAAPVPEMVETTIEVTGDVTILGEPAGMDMDDKQQKGNERADTEPANSRSTPGGFWGAIKSILGVGSSDPGSSVFKALGGGLWFAAYTNNFKDLEGEILAQAAHDRYIARLDAGLVPMPELWHVHEPATKHGQATHVWREGHVICAVGKFDDSPAGRIAEKFYRGRKSGDIELSHGFHYPQWAKSHDGVYEDYNTFEITTINTKFGRGANPYTTFEEIKTMALTEQKKQSIIETFGKDEAERIFATSQKVAERAKALADAGVAYKGEFADLTNTTPKPQPQPEAVKAVISDVLEGQAVILAALETVNKGFVDGMKALDTREKALETREKALDERINQVQALIDAKPRRVDEGNSNVVTDADAEKQLEAAAGVEYDPQYPGMKIPLKKS